MNLVDALNAPTAIVGTTGAGKTFAAIARIARALIERNSK
jgi:superfamily II DNA or RNA helicase